MKLTTALMLSAIASASAFMTPSPNTHSTSRQQTSLAVSADADTKPMGIPGTAELDKPWKELGFEFRQTKSNLRITYKNGEWGEFEMSEVSLLFYAGFHFVTHDGEEQTEN